MSKLLRYKYTLGALAVALTIPLIGGLYHYLIEGREVFRYLPQTPHDRRMALTISCIILAMGRLLDRNNRVLQQHEEEKRRLFRSAISASQHILNNFLNNMLYFQHKAKESKALDPETLKLYDQVIHDAAEQLRKLGELSDISENSIRATVYPKKGGQDTEAP
jgi:signal transduction histidine kinase